ncbi:hypothetical protein RSSM_01789 [Rhodopirellula sallentina SM41]|uniref:Uncharacterized protein n=1 Tax=Rhodopirellula sallentina SM41 TaxID=1263870 RepID=M5UL90_9BACT|nr:hypothetical protein RSSM_01789 [Rhodopirellula sallentina SM41]
MTANQRQIKTVQRKSSGILDQDYFELTLYSLHQTKYSWSDGPGKTGWSAGNELASESKIRKPIKRMGTPIAVMVEKRTIN